MSEKIYAIKCTNCAAPLDILGGGRVQTITCAYCHSVLDLNDHYKVLSTFENVPRSLAPFSLGMRGNIKGVEWTIIGWIHYKTAEFPAEEWDEFFLYSPTHGYAWLVDEEGKLSFSKRVRDFDILTWQEKKPKTTFYHKGHYIRQESSYLTYVEYVEGELSWVAKFGDKFTTWDYNGVRYQSLSIEKTNDELEVYHTEKLNKKDIYTAFSLEYKEDKSKQKASDNDIPIDHTQSSDGVKLLFIALLFMLIFSFFNTKELTSFEIYQDNVKKTFTVDSSAFLSNIEITSQNGLKDSNLTLYLNNNKIFYIDNKIVYYTKKHLKHNWTSDSYITNIYLQLDEGKYTLQFQQKNGYRKYVKISEKVIRLKFILPLFIMITLMLLYISFQKYKHYISGKFILIFFFLLMVLFHDVLFDSDFIFAIFIFIFLIYEKITDFFASEDDDE